MSKTDERPLTRNIRAGEEPLDVAGYERAGGYQAVRKALESMTPEAVARQVKDANLRGRGGAGFPAGVKWSLMPPADASARPRILVANADEMEPGTFKDRVLLEGDPHQLIEGMILAAYAIQAELAYIFLRWEYRLAAHRLEKAIAQAQGKGYLGQRILGSNFSLDLKLHVSAGRYMCGEETALLNALEGRRAIPRAKPPYPQQSGLWGKPTIVNNVETLCNVTHIIDRGAEWFRSLGVEGDGGTKIFGVSGKVRRPGYWELPMGITLGELIEEHAGGMHEGLRLRGVLPGGASTDFLTTDHLDLPLAFDSVSKVGSRLGTGTAIVLDDRTCPVAMVRNLEQFFARESCGFCTPCREGLPWTAKLLGAIEDGDGKPGDIERLAASCRLFGPGHTFCALAPGAAEPMQSALQHFREDFDRHIHERRCPFEAS